MYRTKIITEASKWIGYLEHKSMYMLGIYDFNIGKGGYTVFPYIIRKHYRFRNYFGVPWCAIFLHAVFIEALGKETARKLLGKPHPGTRVLVRRMKRKKRLHSIDYIPNPGDIIFCHNGDGRVSHCGIVVGTKDNMVITIEGNTVDPTGHFEKHQGGAVALRERNFIDDAIVYYASIT